MRVNMSTTIETNFTGTIDNVLSLFSDPRESAVRQRNELQLIYESLVESRRGRTRHTGYTPIGQEARQWNANAIGFLEFVAGQLDRWDRNSPWDSQEHDVLGKLGLRKKGESQIDANPQYDVGFQHSPLAKRIRSQYRGELEKLPILQIDSLWNEILLYAQRGFYGLKQRNAQSAAFANYQLPEIIEMPAMDFLLLPLVSAITKKPINISDNDRNYLETGRQFAERRSLTASYAVYLIEKAASVMKQIAEVHELDISDKIGGKNLLVEKLEGGSFIRYFESSIREHLCDLAAQGRASRVFEEIDSVARSASRHKIPLDLLIAQEEIDLLKAQAVNNPERGLRGELLEIARDVASGQTYMEGDLSKTDRLVAFCDDKSLVMAYQNIRSAITTLADSYRFGYRIPSPMAPAMAFSLSKKPVAASIKPEVSTAVVVPVTRELYPSLRMNDDDAKSILSMLESGDFNGIANYKAIPSAVSHVPYKTDKKGKRSRVGVIAVGGLAAAVIAGFLVMPNQSRSSESPNYRETIEIDCSGIPQTLSGQNIAVYEDRTTGPIYVCKPNEPTKIGISPSKQQEIPVAKPYGVVKGDNLTRVMKRQAGIKDERQAYVTALDYAEEHGIKAPYIIHPGQILMISKP